MTTSLKIKRQNKGYQTIIKNQIFASKNKKQQDFGQLKSKIDKQYSRCEQFDIGHTKKLQIRSDFDSGNIRIIKKISKFQYQLDCLEDGSFTGHKVQSKSWFYFQVSGLPQNQKLTLHINRVNTLMPLFNRGQFQNYKPTYRTNNINWSRLQSSYLTYKQQNNIECVIQYQSQAEYQFIEFAFAIPYPLTKHFSFLKQIQHKPLSDSSISFQKQILIYSPQGRPIHLIAITSKQNINQKNCMNFNQNIFPQGKININTKKPIVFITGRVHPGQTSSSFTAQGIIQELLSNDLRAVILRKMFMFIIVPMINVDGVYHGHFRMDSYGKNLNRYYRNPTIQQSAIFGIKTLAQQIIKTNKVVSYFDLHGHCGLKGCFVYGNALSQFTEQVQSQVFCKLYAMNNTAFSYQNCIFDPNQMNARDFYGNSKDGCGRVVMHQLAKIIHSYTIQCPIMPIFKQEQLQNSNKSFKIDKYGFQLHQQENIRQLTSNTYKGLGRSLLYTLLDIFEKNPYSKIQNSKYKNMQALRRLTAFQVFQSAQRFRKFQKSVFSKVKNINSLINDIYSNRIEYKQITNFQFGFLNENQYITWPSVMKINSNNKRKIIRNTISLQIQQNTCQTQEFILDQNLKNIGNSKQFEIDSDQSEVGDTEKNKQIIQMCIDEKQEQDVIQKIMKNDFKNSDYEIIQKKYKIFQKSRLVYKNIKQQKKNHDQKAKKDLKYYIRSYKNSNTSKQQKNLQKNQQIATLSYNVSNETTQILKTLQATQRKPTAAQQFRKNIYDAIKQEIKDGLRKQYEKRKLKVMSQQKKIESMIIDYQNYHHTRIFTNKKQLRSRVKLPSLGPNMYIVTSSTKVLKPQ